MRSSLVLLLGLGLASCQLEATRPGTATAPLSLHPRLSANLTDSVYHLAERLRLRIWLDDGTLHQEVSASVGAKTLTCDGLPLGRGYRLELAGLDSEGKIVWRGTSEGNSPSTGDVSLGMDVDLTLGATSRLQPPVSNLANDALDFPSVWKLACEEGAVCQYASPFGTPQWNRFPDSLRIDSTTSWLVRSWSDSGIPSSQSLRHDFLPRQLRIKVDNKTGRYDFPVVAAFTTTPSARTEVSLDSGRTWASMASVQIDSSIRILARATSQHQPTSDTLRLTYVGREVPSPSLVPAPGPFDFPMTVSLSKASTGTNQHVSLDTGRTWSSASSFRLDHATKVLAYATRTNQPTSDTVVFEYGAAKVKSPILLYPMMIRKDSNVAPSSLTPGATTQLSSDQGTSWSDWTSSTASLLDTNLSYLIRAVKANQPSSEPIPFQWFRNQTWDRMRRIPASDSTPALWVDTVEVTVKLWRDIMENRTVDSLQPISDVTWIKAALFCNARSKRMGLDTVYRYTRVDTIIGKYTCQPFELRFRDLIIDSTRNGFRIPNNAEWLHIAKPGMDTVASYNMSPYGQFYDGIIRPVAGKRPNLWGIYDVLGNVSEWAGIYAYNPAPDGYMYNLTTYYLGEGASADQSRLSHAFETEYNSVIGVKTTGECGLSGFRCVRNQH